MTLSCSERLQPDLQSLITPLDLPLYRHHGLRVAMLRLDRIHPQISGNKWFKLRGLAERLRAGERPAVLSFGGIWSNHLHALAYLGYLFNIPTLGLVRGNAGQSETAMMEDARRWGMGFVFLGREQYLRRQDDDFLAELKECYPGWEVVPEGGSDRQAVLGCREIWQLLSGSEWASSEYAVCALGTGGTLAGLIAGKPETTRVVGVPVLQLGAAGPEQVASLLESAGVDDPGGWSLAGGGDFGGYARLPAELAAFLIRFEARARVSLDPVYTAKMVSAFHRQVQEGFYPAGSRVLLIHTGGLQGRRGMQRKVEQRAAAFNGPLSV